MAHFARLDQNNVVTEVCVVNNSVITVNGVESEDAGAAFMKSITGHDAWKQTSYSGSFRGCFAGLGYSYDPVLDTFVPPAAPEVTP